MGFPADFPEAVVSARLDAQISSLTAGTNLFMGSERPPDPASGMPHLAVFVRQYGGPNSADMGLASSDRTFRIQVLTRGDVDGRVAALALANSCQQAVTRVQPSEPGYIFMTSNDAGPFDLGVDDTEHPRFTFNIQLMYSG